MGGLYPHLFPAAGPAGDAVLIKFQNPDLGLSPAQIAEMRLAYGADSPLWRQYLHTLLAMLHGDFGYSLQAGLRGQQSDCQQPAGYLKPRAAGLPAGGGAGVRPRFRPRGCRAALAEQFSAVATGAVYLSTYLLVGYRPDPALPRFSCAGSR